jgi:hypothetical protein
MKVRLLAAVIGLLVAGCVAERPAPVVSQAAPVKAAEAQESIVLFEHLVSTVRRYHVFSSNTEKNLGKSWEDDLPRLRDQFRRATTERALTTALFHFVNSLHDAHCQFHPKERGERLGLSLTVGAERVDDQIRFYVDRVNDPELAKTFAPGDVVVSIDGVPAGELLRANDLASNMNSWDNIARSVATYLTRRSSYATTVTPGTTSSWRVRPRRGGPEKSATLHWRQTDSAGEGADFALDYDNADCANADPADYGGGYRLTARGYRACIYTSTEPRYRDYPVVRHVSFMYDQLHGVEVDHQIIGKALAALPNAKGIVLDLQDNGGGMNPNFFLDWWADKPYVDRETHVVLADELLHRQPGGPHVNYMNKAIRRWYEDALRAKNAKQRFSPPRPFMCQPDTCNWDNVYRPRHRVTTLPVALLVGPSCASSCDSFAWQFDRSDLGPIVGRRPAAGFTVHRASFEVVPKPGALSIGSFDLAASYDTAPGDADSLEGRAITLDVPIDRTFENRATYDKLLVDGAIGALERRPHTPAAIADR